MSEKIKGMFGSETRADEVLEWLKSQGATESIYEGSSERSIYYVDKGQVEVVNKRHAVLFDIVELSRWRAEKGGEFYFVHFTGKVCSCKDERDTTDNAMYEIGNYFQTKKEAEIYTEKFREIFKRKEE